ncbi:helix-turn-helix transcriptional regulator [Flavobacterium sp.]|jgi:predicted DNA-binding transcriptional regulator AlpA|uniref:helix-turn-helix transcriptional regulator n=1 Tax=Flavobacterium sp. TaxID=239 RepID=UPI0037C06B97
MNAIKILRWPEALERLGISESSYRNGIADGTLPKPIHLCARAVGLPEHELNQVIRARIAGLPAAEIRKIVEQIHEERARIAAELIGGAA